MGPGAAGRGYTRGLKAWGCGVWGGHEVTGGQWWLHAQGCAAQTKHHTTKIHFSRPKKACLLWEGISGCSLSPRRELDEEVSGWIPT